MESYQNAFSQFLATARPVDSPESVSQYSEPSMGTPDDSNEGVSSRQEKNVPQDLSIKSSVTGSSFPKQDSEIMDLSQKVNRTGDATNSGETKTAFSNIDQPLNLVQDKPPTDSSTGSKRLGKHGKGLFGSPKKSGGSKLDKIAQKLMGGFSEIPVPSFLKNEPQTNSPVVTPQESDREPKKPEVSHDPIPERPFSEVVPLVSYPDSPFVEELVSEDLPPEYGEEDMEEETSEIPESVSQNTNSEPSSVQIVSEHGEDTKIASEQEKAEIDVSEIISEVVENAMDVAENSLGVAEQPADSIEGTVDEVEAGNKAVEGEESKPTEAQTPGTVVDHHKVTADKVFEYQWPRENGDIYMLQEQVSEYLGILSFKRKYPDLARRNVEYKERIFLMDSGAVTETQSDLGLTVLRSEEVYDLMAKDYPAKYKDYIQTLRDKEKKRLTEEQKGYNLQNLTKAKMDFFMKKAVRSAAEYNANFMREKREERRAFFDLQTFGVHFPRSKYKPLPKEMTKVGTYPLALIPGQYSDYYKSYTSQELKYFPIKTAVYSPPRALNTIYADPNEEEEKDSADEEKEERGSSSSDDSSDSSDSETDSIEAETDRGKISEEQIKKLLATPRPDTPPKKTRRRGPQLNGTDTCDSEKDSESGSTKGRSRKSVGTGKRTPAKTPKRPVVKGRPLLNKCSICLENAKSKPDEELMQCSECKKHAHTGCLDLTEEMLPVIKTYSWQCMECKSCVKCKDAQDEETMMFCDHCDRGYHTYCVGLDAIPPGRWECPSCTPDDTPAKKAKLK